MWFQRFLRATIVIVRGMLARMAKAVVDSTVWDLETRPFGGLPDEPGWVAMREILPSATATARTTAEHGSKEVQIVTVLPGGYAGMHRPDGTILLSVQDAMASDTLSADLAASLLATLAAEPGTAIAPVRSHDPSVVLQNVLDLTTPLSLALQDSYDYWLDASAERTAEITQSLEEAAAATVPMAEVPGISHAYWCQMNRPFVRWVRAEDEDDVVKALARLQAKRAASLTLPGGEARFLGMFRAAGLTVPVWELPDGTTAEDLAAPMAEFADLFDSALAATGPLDASERRARDGILSRQLTLR